MRIALVSQEYPPESAKGGLGTQTYAKAHGLSGLGHDVVVISRAPDGSASERKDGRVHLVRTPGSEKRMPLHTEVADWVTYSAAVAETVARIHGERPWDLVEFPEWAAEGYVHLINRTPWNTIPTVVHLHGPLMMFGHAMGWPDTASDFFRIGTQLERVCVRMADAIMSSSQCSLDWCVKHYGRDPTGVPVLHTGIDSEKFAPQPGVAKADRPTIVFAGKLAANKGVFTLLEAAIEVAREIPRLRLRFLGRGADNVVTALRKRTSDAGRPDLLDLPGFVAHDELPVHFSAAHVFAGPSLYEAGPGLVNLEAMACGLPVITTTGSGSAEVVQHESTGLLVPPDQPAELARALLRLLGDDGFQRRLGRAAREYAVEHADSRKCIRRIEAFYRSVVDGTHGQVRTDAPQ